MARSDEDFTSRETERLVEQALQVLAALLSYRKDGEVPPAQLLAEAGTAINGLKSISVRYSHQSQTETP